RTGQRSGDLPTYLHCTRGVTRAPSEPPPADLIPMSELIPHGLLELVLEVEELDRAAAFYRDLLGMREVVRWQAERPAVWLKLGEHQVLGLWPPSSGGPGVGIQASRGGTHVHFAFYVPAGTLEEWFQ